MTEYPERKKLTRRAFLVSAGSFLAGVALFGPTQGLAMVPKYHPLSLYHTHTGETLNIDFHPQHCTPQLLRRVNHFLRDFRTGDVHTIDPKLLALLCLIQRTSKSRGTFEIISGYRSPATNTRLRKASSGVARHSLHMAGKAIDIRLSDLRTSKLRDMARSLKRGGVGYYAKSDFVHLDTGRFRTW